MSIAPLFKEQIMVGQIYNSDLKEEADIEALANHLRKFVKTFGVIKIIAWTTQEQPVPKVPVFSEEMRKQMLR